MKIKIITAVLCIAVFAGSCISYSDYSHVFAEEHFEYEDYRYTILEDDTVNLYFYVDKTVESLDIPSEIDGRRVSTIDIQTFINLNNLKKVNIPKSITQIKDDAFCNCISLTEVEIPDSLTEIPYGLFSGCTSLKDITIPETITRFGNHAFEGTPWLENEKEKNQYVAVNNILISGYTKDGEGIIPENVTEIADGAFQRELSLCRIDVPDYITDLGCSTFDLCSNLKEVNLPEGIEELKYDLFGFCTGLKKVRIPESVKIIGDHTFAMCDNLSEINIPENVTEIKKYAFWGCRNLSEIYLSENVVNIGKDAFLDTAQNFVIYGKKDSYAHKYAIENNIIFSSVDDIDGSILYGDINGDDVITLSDFIKLAKYILNRDEKIISENSDINHDGAIDSTDIIMLRKKFMK